MGTQNSPRKLLEEDVDEMSEIASLAALKQHAAEITSGQTKWSSISRSLYPHFKELEELLEPITSSFASSAPSIIGRVWPFLTFLMCVVGSFWAIL